jgi:hypothetical protein
MQLLDRMCVCKLKAFHYVKSGNMEAAAQAEEQAQDLSLAAEVYLIEVMRGQRQIKLHRHLRFHRHKQLEAWRVGKAQEASGDSLMRIIGELMLTHAEYWENQSAINHLKGVIDSQRKDSQAYIDANISMVKRQRRVDALNDHRSELIQRGDHLFSQLMGENHHA